jgi:UDP-glucose 4-epimerase
MDVASPNLIECIHEFMPEIVIHTAAQVSVRQSMENPLEDAKTNVMGLLNLLQSFQGMTLPYFVFTSTGGAMYGEQESFPASESHKIAPECAYGVAKRACELYLDLWRRQLGLQYVALRFANVYGPRQNAKGEAGVVAIFCERLLTGKPAIINGTGAQTRDFVYVKDVVQAISLAISKKASGIYNIGTGIETSVKQVYAILCDVLRLKASPQYGPAKNGEQMRSCIDPRLAEKTLGWKSCTNLQQGLAETSAWFQGALSK